MTELARIPVQTRVTCPNCRKFSKKVKLEDIKKIESFKCPGCNESFRNPRFEG